MTFTDSYDEEFPPGSVDRAVYEADVFTRQKVKDAVNTLEGVFQEHLEEAYEEHYDHPKRQEAVQSEVQSLRNEVIGVFKSYFAIDYDQE